MEQAARSRTLNAFRPGTRANHQSHLLLYTAFSLHFKINPFPASPKALVLFGEFLIRGYRAPRSVTNAFSSVRAFHLDGGMDASAFSSRQLTLFRRALPITLRHVPAHAPPIPFPVLERLCTAAQDRGTEGVVFAALLAVTFFAMARLSSLAPPWHPSFADVRVTDKKVHLRIKWGKCNQSADQGFSVPLLPLRGSSACPVALLATLAAGASGPPSTTPLFSIQRKQRRAGSPRARFLTAGAARNWLSSLLGVGPGAWGRKVTPSTLLDAGPVLELMRRGLHFQICSSWEDGGVTQYAFMPQPRQREPGQLSV